MWAALVVSSEQQADTLPHQRAWAQETAKNNGWTISRFFEGVASGKDGPRRLLRDVVAEIRLLQTTERPRFVLMIRLDRVGRGSITESAVVLHELKALGVGVWTRDQGEMRLDSAMDELIVAAQLAVARHENDVRKEKMRSHYRRRRSEGLIVGHRPPYGLEIAPDGKSYIADPARMETVREAFVMRVAGAGYHTIALKLNAIAPPQVYKNGRTYSVRWTQTRVRRLLEQRGYIGPIIDEVTFARAQRPLQPDRSRDGRRRFPWPLSGALRCFCGRAMHGMATAAGGSRRTRKYACRATWTHGKILFAVAERLEAQFMALLDRLAVSPELARAYREKAAEPPGTLRAVIIRLEREIHEIDRKRKGVWELHAAGRVRADDVQERLDELASQRAELAHRLVSAKDRLASTERLEGEERNAVAIIQQARKAFLAASEPEQRQIALAIAHLVGGLYVDEHGELALGPVHADAPQRRTRQGKGR